MKWEKLLRVETAELDELDRKISRDDYDTIICSTLFRRLQDKAQVFPLDEDDYVRTRLTHSLEVSAIGKKLGEYVFALLKKEKKDPWFETHTEKAFSDVLLCAGLVHDIGNPPFGHFGEYAIREWFQDNLATLYLDGVRVIDILTPWQTQDLLCFESNAQSLRLLSKTPYMGNEKGFDLSSSVLGAMMKYPASSEDFRDMGYRKLGYFYAERDLFRVVTEQMGMDHFRHPLSFLLEAADDIAYRTSDMEDAMVKKVISYQQITELLHRYVDGLDMKDAQKTQSRQHIQQLDEFYRQEQEKKKRKPELTAVQRWNQYMQGAMIKDAAETFVKNYDTIMSGSYRGNLFDQTATGCVIGAIADLSERLIYTSPVKTRTELFGRRVIHSLMDLFMPAAIVFDTDAETSFIQRRTVDTVSNFYKSMYSSEAAGKNERDKLYLRILMITDYISGMTDNYAKRLYQELFA